MKQEIKIPNVGESVSEVTVAKFLKPTGVFVKEGEELVELETEKVNQVLYASGSGTVEWSVKEGDNVAIGSVIGIIDSEKKEQEPKPAWKEEEPQKEKPKKEEAPKEEALPKEEAKLRKTKEDFISELKKESQREEKPAPKEEKKIGEEPKSAARETRRRMSKIRETIAARLVQSLHTSAMLTTFNEADMHAILELRNKYKESFQAKYGVKLGFMSFFVKAVVEALKEFPGFNSYLDKGEIVERHYFDIGIAVAAPKGLFVPVIRGCDRLSFADIERKIEGYAKRAREGALSIEDLQGGGVTITNGGVFGSMLSTPILNPPQVGILGMHKIMKRAVVIDDQIVIRPMMYLALSYDHRVVDGKEAVSFLVRIKEYLEEPARLILFEADENI